MSTLKLQREDFPDWIHPDLADIQAELDLVGELWDGLRHGTIKKHIIQESTEPDLDYKNRVAQTEFDNLFTPTITGYSGLLSNFKLSEDVAASITQNIDNVDGQGSNLKVFLTDGDNAVLRDGCCAYLIDHPDTSGLDLSSTLKVSQAQLRPYISLIDRRNILNHSIVTVNGEAIIEMIIIRTTRLVKKGRYGVEPKTIYKVFERGVDGSNCSVTSYSIETVEGEKTLTQVGGVAFFKNRQDIPIILYSTNDREPLKALPPFLNSARLNVKLLRKTAQLDEVMRRINLPVAVVSDDNTGQVNPTTGHMEFKEISIGCNTVVHTSSVGKFYFSEPTGAAIKSTQDDIAALLKAIDRVSLAFLSGGKEGAMTATEALLNTAQVTTTIAGIARRKESCVQSLFKLWCSFVPGETVVGTIAIDDSVIKPAITDQGAQVILDAIGVSISPELGLQILKDRRWADFDVEAELQRRGHLTAPLLPEASQTHT
jgi:hypothetical protein